MILLRSLLVLWTLAMLALHLASRPILRRAFRSSPSLPAWLTAVNIVRFEGAYYVALLLFAGFSERTSVLAPLAILGLIHIGGWTLSEVRRSALASLELSSAARLERILLGIQLFDFAEAFLLAYIAWKLFLPFL